MPVFLANACATFSVLLAKRPLKEFGEAEDLDWG